MSAPAVLDYGAPDGEQEHENATMASMSNNNNPVVDPSEVYLQDAGMDAEMQDWEDRYEGREDEYESQRRQKLDELMAQRKSAKFYALPLDNSIEAGARRGVQAQSAVEDDDLITGVEQIDTPAPELPATIGQGLDIRYNALHITGLPITQCSTSRLFAYITHFGAQPLGLEWINDQSCNVVFSSASAARLAIQYLCPANHPQNTAPLLSEQELEHAAQVKRMHDSGEDLQGGQSFEWTEAFMLAILTPRRAHRIPAKMYNAPERDAAAARQKFELEAKKLANNGEVDGQIDEDRPEIYRELEEQDRQRFLTEDTAQQALSKLRSTLWIRWSVETFDVKGSRAAAQSQWYREHGRDAGKEVVSKVLQVGGDEDRRELLPSTRDAQFKRNGGGHGRQSTGRIRGRGHGNGGGGGAAMDELDRELDAWRDRADDAIVGGDAEARRRRRRGSRSAATMAALDEEMELDQNQRQRSASPVRRHHTPSHNGGGNPSSSSKDGGSIRVRGRGRMRAPSAWDNEDAGRFSSSAARYSTVYDNDARANGRTQLDNDNDISLARRLGFAGADATSSGKHGGRTLDQRLAPANNRGELLDRIR